MTGQERVRVFDSQGEAYKQAFQIFLDHTDQKRNAKRWLQQVVDRLPTRNVLIDAGAGNGEGTRTFAPAFRIPVQQDFLQIRSRGAAAVAYGRALLNQESLAGTNPRRVNEIPGPSPDPFGFPSRRSGK